MRVANLFPIRSLVTIVRIVVEILCSFLLDLLTSCMGLLWQRHSNNHALLEVFATSDTALPRD